MKLGQRILRWVNPQGEDERMAFRQCVAMTHAHAIDVDRTISMKQDEFSQYVEKPAVQFDTFADGCKFRVAAITPRLCRHEKHPEKVESSLALCKAEKCPFMLGLVK